MKNLRELLVILSVFLSIVVLPLKGYALDNEVEQINLLTNDTKLKIEKFIEENMDKGKVPGLAVTLVKGD
ncbi:serine hydrolase, partial [Bacillus wiedmannii]